MLRRAVGCFRESPAAPPLTDPDVIAARYRRGRAEVLTSSMVGYGLFYFCRKNLSVALPLMGPDLGYSNAQLGVLGSVLYATYGVSKFLSGLVADRAHPRRFLLVGLLLSAACSIAFGLSSSLLLLALFWGLNGIVQSTGAPACAKLLATWFGAGERGTKTAIWNISHQGGGFLVLVMAGFFAAAFGWRAAMIGPAILTAVIGLFVARWLRDRPEAEGLPPVAEFRGEDAPYDDEPYGSALIRRVLLNRRVWIVALASCFTYVVRYGALDWAPKYLFEVRGFAIAEASSLASLLELIGIPGALLCGWLSDRVFGSRRAPVVFASLLLLAASVWGLFRVAPGNPGLDALLLAAVGFFTYGPQMLLAGVAPVDMSSRRVAAAAVGFTGLMSYAGAFLSSTVTGLLLDGLGWGAAFDFWVAAALVAAMLCMVIASDTPVRAAAPQGLAEANG